MKKEKLKCDTAREIPIVEFLKRNGHFPVRKKQNSAWYLSPIRKENEASFKVSKILNRWYDHGAGKGGNIIDLVIEMNNNCPVQKALSILDQNTPSFSFQQQNTFALLKPEDEIEVEKVVQLRHPALVNYLLRRKINPTVVSKFARQIHYQLKGKQYFAIGIENVSENSISVYPNPANELVNITTSGKGKVEVYNIAGELIYSEIINNVNSTIDISNFVDGVYLLEITSNEQRYNHKLIVN